MPSQRTKRISDREWQEWKSELHRLYLEENRPVVTKIPGKGADGVKFIMERDHRFSASKSQYESQFKRWKWSKNRTSQCWQAIVFATSERSHLGKLLEPAERVQSIVYIDGKLVPPEKIQRETSRFNDMITHQLVEDPPQLPRGVVVCSPVLNGAGLFVSDLPYRQLERRIQQHMLSFRPSEPDQPTINPRFLLENQMPAPWTSNSPGNDWTTQGLGCTFSSCKNPSGFTTALIRTQESVWSSLGSVLPPSLAAEVQSMFAVGYCNTHILASPLYRCLLFSIANNFAGLSADQRKELLGFLQKETTGQLYRLIRASPGYSSRAIIRNLFIAAIECGDERIVSFILNDETSDLDVNSHYFGTYTPIEMACERRHDAVIRTLLRYGADVNLSFFTDKFRYKGALNHYLFPNYDESKPDYEVVLLLLDADKDIRIDTIENVLQRFPAAGEALIRVMASKLATNHPKWKDAGIFHKALEHLDEASSLELVKLMDEVGADLNVKASITLDTPSLSPSRPSSYCTRALIDIAALRGFLSVVEYLSTHGAKTSKRTFPNAIQSLNATLVRSLLSTEHSARERVCSEDNVIAAICTGSMDILRLLFEYGEIEKQPTAAGSSTAYQSTTPTDLCSFIKELIESGYFLSPRVLGVALAYAILEEQDCVAQFLIDAGAALDGFGYADEASFCGPTALWFAVKRQDTGLVRRLLEVGANPAVGEQSYQPLSLAVMQGDHAIVELLIFAGAKTWSPSYHDHLPLIEALKQGDSRLVRLVLDSGEDPNETIERGVDPVTGDEIRISALSVAIENCDVEIIQLLLNRGADPHNQEALRVASFKDETLLWLLVKSHQEKYPAGRVGFGSKAMINALKTGQTLLVETMLHMGFDCSSLVPSRFVGRQETSPFGIAIKESSCGADLLAKFLQHSKGCAAESIVTPDWGGRETALIAAIGSGDISKVRLLIEHGANVNRPASFRIRRTPLQKACEFGDGEIVQLLLRYGADVNGAPALRGGATALQLAAIKGHLSIAAELLSRKADVDAPAPKPDGRTALEGAAEHGRLDMVKSLLETGAGACGKDAQQFERAMAFAEKNGFHPVSDMLRDWCHKQPYIETFNDFVDLDL